MCRREFVSSIINSIDKNISSCKKYARWTLFNFVTYIEVPTKRESTNGWYHNIQIRTAKRNVLRLATTHRHIYISWYYLRWGWMWCTTNNNGRFAFQLSLYDELRSHKQFIYFVKFLGNSLYLLYEYWNLGSFVITNLSKLFSTIKLVVLNAIPAYSFIEV